MTVGKLVGGLVVIGVVGVGAYDGLHVVNAHRDMANIAGEAAGSAAHAIFTTHDETQGSAAAERSAAAHHAVVTSYHYDPVAAQVMLTVSGSVKSLVLRYVDSGLVDDVTATAKARPG